MDTGCKGSGREPYSKTKDIQNYPFLPMSENGKYAADWTVVGPQRRLIIPHTIAAQVPWLNPSANEALLMQLVQGQRVIVRPDAAISDQLTIGRQALAEEYAPSESMRRIAFTHHVFRQVAYESRARRLKLRPAVLKHMGLAEGDDVFCLMYGDQLEMMSAAEYARLFGQLSDDLPIG